jgi:hypothetical protein
VNTLAWHWYAGNKPLLFSLGPFATPSQVYQATSHDADAGTRPIAMNTEELAQAYYGWKFGVSPLQEFEQLGCPKPTAA